MESEPARYNVAAEVAPRGEGVARLLSRVPLAHFGARLRRPPAQAEREECSAAGTETFSNRPRLPGSGRDAGGPEVRAAGVRRQLGVVSPRFQLGLAEARERGLLSLLRPGPRPRGRPQGGTPSAAVSPRTPEGPCRIRVALASPSS